MSRRFVRALVALGVLVVTPLHARSGQAAASLRQVDHLVYAVPDLDAGVADLERRLGVRAAPGGQHPGRGTRNAILALGQESYLEILAPDPSQPVPTGGRWFGVDAAAPARLAGWAAKGADLPGLAARAAQRGVPLGPVVQGSRARPDGVLLHWTFTDPAVPAVFGLAPFFIDWGTSPHPAGRAPPRPGRNARSAAHPPPGGTRTARAGPHRASRRAPTTGTRARAAGRARDRSAGRSGPASGARGHAPHRVRDDGASLMASIMSHAVAASSLGAVGSPHERMPARYWIALAIVAALPDADVISFAYGVPYGNILGHRGLTHSLPFAAVVAALVVRLVFRGREWHRAWPRLWVVFFAAIASHGLLDAMTTGGQGIAFLAPFSAARWFLPWRPILVSPIGVGAFISAYGLRVLQNELVWVWLPSALVAVAARLVRHRQSRAGTVAA